jgi:hypothetical protein
MNGNCREVRRELSAWLDGEVTPAQTRLIEDHLAGCAACRQERDALRGTRNLLAANGRLEAPPSWVQEARRAAAGDARPSRTTRLGRPLALSTMAAAALLAVIVLSLRLFEPSAVATRDGGDPLASLSRSKPDVEADGGAPPEGHEPSLAPSRPPATAPPAPRTDLQARGFQDRRDEAPSAGKDQRNAPANELAKEKIEASRAPDTAIATDSLDALDSAAKKGAVAGAVSSALPLPVIRLTAAQILPPPVSTVSQRTEAPRALLRQPAAPSPPAESGSPARAKSAAPRRVIVTLGPGRRILAARPAGDGADPADAAFASDLIGCVIASDVVFGPSSGGVTTDPNAGITEVVLEIAPIESSPAPAP